MKDEKNGKVVQRIAPTQWAKAGARLNLGANPVGNRRRGEISVQLAIVWLLENGWEVFQNVGSTGPAHLVITRSPGVVHLVSVRTLPASIHNVVDPLSLKWPMTEEQIENKVNFLFVDQMTGACYWGRRYSSKEQHQNEVVSFKEAQDRKNLADTLGIKVIY